VVAREFGRPEAVSTLGQLARWATLPSGQRPPPWAWIEALWALATLVQPGNLADCFGPAGTAARESGASVVA
jgi:hypothetical protein